MSKEKVLNFSGQKGPEPVGYGIMTAERKKEWIV